MSFVELSLKDRLESLFVDGKELREAIDTHLMKGHHQLHIHMWQVEQCGIIVPTGLVKIISNDTGGII